MAWSALRSPDQGEEVDSGRAPRDAEGGLVGRALRAARPPLPPPLRSSASPDQCQSRSAGYGRGGPGRRRGGVRRRVDVVEHAPVGSTSTAPTSLDTPPPSPTPTVDPIDTQIVASYEAAVR